LSWYLHALLKYRVFTGRARRKEYWYFVLFNTLILLLLDALDSALGLRLIDTESFNIGVLGGLFLLATLVPAFAVAARRLHDTDRSVLWLPVFFVPLVGPLILLYFFVQRGTAGPNRFGPDPLAADSSAEA
jgi:uncharacterized membrane protein YhaH (DUF805 family)